MSSSSPNTPLVLQGSWNNSKASKRGKKSAIICFHRLLRILARNLGTLGPTNWKILFHSSHGIPEISFRNFWSNGKRPLFFPAPSTLPASAGAHHIPSRYEIQQGSAPFLRSIMSLKLHSSCAAPRYVPVMWQWSFTESLCFFFFFYQQRLCTEQTRLLVVCNPLVYFISSHLDFPCLHGPMKFILCMASRSTKLVRSVADAEV